MAGWLPREPVSGSRSSFIWASRASTLFPTGRTCEGAGIHEFAVASRRDRSEFPESAQWRGQLQFFAGSTGEWAVERSLSGEADTRTARFSQEETLATPPACLVRHRGKRRIVAPPDSSCREPG